MGILPIGFFSPLPLAMMIPFMATQSLAMGEAFGKSFQYGKRKISSMSNEEFNKLTFHDLMVEQTANISAIVPELSKQMAQSQTMQKAIFQEMVNLIPTFFDSLFSALKPEHIENQTLIQANQQAPPTEIRYYNDRQGIPEESEQLKELKELLAKSLEQRGTKDNLASDQEAAAQAAASAAAKAEAARVEALRFAAQQEAASKTFEITTTKEQQQKTEFALWVAPISQAKTHYLQSIQYEKIWRPKVTLWKKAGGNMNLDRRTRVERQMKLLSNQARVAALLISRASNEYRHPNPLIGKHALLLRKQRANGQWTTNKLV